MPKVELVDMDYAEQDEVGEDQSPTFDMKKIRSDGSPASRNRLSQTGRSRKSEKKNSIYLKPKGQDVVSSGPSFGDDFDEGSGRNLIDEESGNPLSKGKVESTIRVNSTFALTSKRIKASAGDAVVNASSDIKKVVPKLVGRNSSFGS